MGEHCQICGEEYKYIYEVSNELWEKITGIKNGSGLRCIPCLNKEAREKRIIMYWYGKENKEGIMNDKLTPEMIRQAVKVLRKYKVKPDKDVFTEIEDPRIGTDFLSTNQPIVSRPEPFDRDEVQELRHRFHCLNVYGCNPHWRRLYERIEDDLNTLDAFIARTEIK